MKPFDLVGARKGAPICTRDGHAARLLSSELNNETFPLVAATTLSCGTENVAQYMIDGRFYAKDSSCGKDLMMVEENDPPLIGEKYIQHFDND